MFTGWLLAALVAVAPAQGVEVVQPSQAELFANQLRLDSRTQGPAVQALLNTAAEEAAPIVEEMLQIRQELVNLAIRNADMTGALERYAAAAARMAALETRTFKNIYAELRENQHSRAAEAFRIMGGLFLPSATTGVGGGGRGGGRGGD
jgi:hypothetical protein